MAVDGMNEFGFFLREVWIACGDSPMACKFDKMVRRLNGYGPQWALDNLSTVVGWMVEHARNRGMEYDEAAIGGLVTRLAKRVLRDASGRMEAVVGHGTQSIPGGEAPAEEVSEGSDAEGQRSGDGESNGSVAGDAAGGGSPPIVEGR